MLSCNGKKGHAYLSMSYVLFDSLFSDGPDSDNQVAIPLEEIESITKVTLTIHVKTLGKICSIYG